MEETKDKRSCPSMRTWEAILVWRRERGARVEGAEGQACEDTTAHLTCVQCTRQFVSLVFMDFMPQQFLMQL